MKNIVLIGFMGVGKGTVARELHRQSKMITIDTDDLIESMEGKKVKEIFAQDGEKYFRKLENRLSKWLSKDVKNAIISTGGGFFKTKHIKEIGTIILLHSPFEEIYARILAHPQAQKKLAKRPLFSSPQKAKELYEQRLPQYKEIADIIIDVTGKDEVEVAREILEKVS